jgi:capsular exopolysaccharide synthesis family protein
MDSKETTTFSEDIYRYFNIIWRRFWIIALLTILFGVSAFLISKRMTPIYQATTTVLINEAPATKTTDYTAIVTSERLAQTYAQLMSKQPVLERVITELDLPLTPAQLKERMFIQPVNDTTLIEVRVDDPDPERAALITNTIVDEFSKQNQELQASRYAATKTSLEEQLDRLNESIQKIESDLLALEDTGNNQSDRDRLEANQAQNRQTYTYLLQSYEQVRLVEAQSTSNIVQVEPATTPGAPIRPRIIVNTSIAALIGFLIAIGGILLVEALDDTLKGPDEITSQLGLPVLGIIPKHEITEGAPITVTHPRSPVTEAFRTLRTNIQYASVDRHIQSLLITSPSPAEGKSTVAVNFGVVLAQNGRSTIVLDADLRRPRVHKVLGVLNKKGLSNLFVMNQFKLEDYLLPTSTENLSVLTAGDLPPNPSELLGSERMQIILQNLKDKVDYTVIDSPPVMAVTDSAVLAPKVDGVLLVVKPGETQLAIAKKTVEMLRRGDVHLLGVVLNEVNMRHSRYYYKGYYYSGRYYLDSEKSGRRKKAWFKTRNKS